jgi:predicted Zn finger-like uncharacterized protein
LKVVCPKCKSVYSIFRDKIDFDKRKRAKCVKCESLFYVEKREKNQKTNNKTSKVTFLLSYLEKRNCVDRRNGSDRRKKINDHDLPFAIPPRDFIPIFNESHIVGYIGPGRRELRDQRSGIDRRNFLTN